MSNSTIPLSQREIEILRLVATGATNQQIAAQLDITLNTVKVHLRNIFAKIGVASRTEASLYAVRAGLVVIDPPAPPHTPLDPPASASPTPAPASVHTATATPIDAPASPASVPIDPPAPPAPASATAPTVAARPTMRPWLPGAAVALILMLIVALVWMALRTPAAAIQAPLPATNASPVPARWFQLAPMGAPRARFGLVSDDGRLYVVGGTGDAGVSGMMERYNPQSNTWTTLTAKPTPVVDVQAVAIGGLIYVAGGQLAAGAISDLLEVYDPDQDQWRTLAPLPEPRSQYATATVDGKLYLFGGWDGSAYRSEVWMFDPDGGNWQTRAPLPSPRGQMSATVVNNRIHLLGGRDADGPLALHQVYDPTQDREGRQPWRVLPRLPEAVARPAAVTVINSIYTFDPQSGELMNYDANTETWTTAPTELPMGNTDLAAVLVNNQIYLLGQTGAGADSSFNLAFEALYRSQLPLISR